jgi:RNA polymerase sigma-70 factor (sigma-E family)
MSSARDGREFSAFARDQGPRLLRAAEYLTNDPHNAQDLVQVSLTKVYLAWAAARRGDTYAYARRVLVNCHTDTWRRRRWRESLVAEPPDVALAPDGSDPARWIVDRDALVRDLALLTDRERAIVVLRYCEDMSVRDVADALNVSPGTVKSTASRALAKLRAAASPQDEKENVNAIA